MIRERLDRAVELRAVIRMGQRRFGRDPRYCLESVENGFAPRAMPQTDDTDLLMRICTAYKKAAQRQREIPEAFRATDWWQLVQSGHLGPVMEALAECDVQSLRAMYANFFRDPCGAGLTGLPLHGAWQRERHLVLIDALHRLDEWRERTRYEYGVEALRSPDIGNPVGVSMDGILVRTGSEEQHFYADKIIALSKNISSPIVAEIGGGYGGMAYYLLRDCSGITYVNFDVPETIALASYYLLKAFPQLTATLYGEAELDEATLRDSDIILMPSFEMPNLPDNSVDIAFTSHVLSDLSSSSLAEYMAATVRTTRGHILHLNRRKGCDAAAAFLFTHAPEFELMESTAAAWNAARSLRADEFEYLYSHQDWLSQPVI